MTDSLINPSLTPEDIAALERLVLEGGIYHGLNSTDTDAGKELDRIYVEWRESAASGVSPALAHQGATIAVEAIVLREAAGLAMARLLPLPTDESKESAAVRATFSSMQATHAGMTRMLRDAANLLGLTSVLKHQPVPEARTLKDELREKRRITDEKNAAKSTQTPTLPLGVRFSDT